VSGFALAPWPVFEDDERDAVDAVLRSGKANYWTGSICRDFEQAWSGRHAGRRSLAMANGSLTLDAALRVLGVGPGDEVIVASRSYVASAMCVAVCGAAPVFADVDPDSGCVTAATLEAVRSSRTRAAIPVHLGGWPCDMPAISEWASRHGILLVEDCAQAHGATIAGRVVGTWGEFASWSFCQDKIMTTGGEGGMLASANEALHKSAWSLAQHGKDHDLAFSAAEHGGSDYRWLVEHPGTNLRMTEMQAAVGLRQLAKLDRWLAARARNAGIMQEALRGVPSLRVPATPAGHSHYRCVAFIEGPLPEATQRRGRCLEALRGAGVPAMHGSCSEIYRERFFADRGYAPREPLPVAHRLGATSLTFLVHHTIGETSMRSYAAAAARVIRGIC
jgi:dTDP-4-amino-4,6-dideoxygalactose transaminase